MENLSFKSASNLIWGETIQTLDNEDNVSISSLDTLIWDDTLDTIENLQNVDETIENLENVPTNCAVHVIMREEDFTTSSSDFDIDIEEFEEFDIEEFEEYDATSSSDSDIDIEEFEEYDATSSSDSDIDIEEFEEYDFVDMVNIDGKTILSSSSFENIDRYQLKQSVDCRDIPFQGRRKSSRVASLPHIQLTNLFW